MHGLILITDYDLSVMSFIGYDYKKERDTLGEWQQVDGLESDIPYEKRIPGDLIYTLVVYGNTCQRRVGFNY